LPGLKLWVVCDRFPRLSGVEVVGRPWSSATEAAELAECDIGISWLPDDPWSEGKCGLKVLQYMAAGLPVVANPVGMHRELVVHGRTGFLASTPGQWSAAIGRLAADPGLRRRMGAAARRVVEEEFSVARWGAELAEVVARAKHRASTERTAGNRRSHARRSVVGGASRSAAGERSWDSHVGSGSATPDR
ncbi:MAG: glycosyltransferase, partial [Planctomycetes bacterium]|nr:glycosyltransferase [Planctomycetota bacterium]